MKILLSILTACLLLAGVSNATLRPSDFSALHDVIKAFTNHGSLGWDLSSDPCHFKWLLCPLLQDGSGDRYVARLTFEGVTLGGTLSPSINQLVNIKYITMTNAGLTGTIPDMSGLVNVISVFMFNNGFTSIASGAFNGLISLQTMSLSGNSFGGTPVPPSIGSCTSLTTLNLAGSGIGGTLPSSFGQLASLQSLDLQSNSISGSIPSSWGSLSSLQILQINNNHLTGSIPDSLTSDTLLTKIDLHGNQLSGGIPTNIGLLSSLQSLNLQSNKLTGSIPNSLGSISTLTSLNLGFNDLSGSIPSFMSKFGSNSYKSNSFCSTTPGAKCSGSVSALLDLLASLGSPSVLSTWSGNDPCSGWLGITCSGTSVVAIVLPKRGLTGTISSSLSSISTLKIINLSGNSITGSIPTSLASIKSLLNINLSNNKLTGTIPLFASNVVTDFSGNPGLIFPSPPASPPSPPVPPPLSPPPPAVLSPPPVVIASPPPVSASIPPPVVALSPPVLSLIPPPAVVTSPFPSPSASIPPVSFSPSSPPSTVNPPPGSKVSPPPGTVVLVPSPPPKSRKLSPPPVSPSAVGGSPSPPPPADNSSGSPPPSSSSSGSSMGIIIGIIVAVVVILAIAGCCCYYFLIVAARKDDEKKEPATLGAASINGDGSTAGPGSYSTRSGDVRVHVDPAGGTTIQGGNQDMVIPIEVIRIATNNFDPAKIVGRGGFGTVYQGQLPDGTLVAVKRMEVGPVSNKGKTEFEAEIGVLTKVRHRHLVGLLGYVADKYERLLVYEYMPQGPLSRHLFEREKYNFACLDWDARVSIALDVARGMEYLHSLAHKSFIHRDLKPSNILLDDSFRAKVSDFGLVRHTDGIHSIETRLAGTFGYLAPEYAVTGRITTKSDVYSFGVVLMELITGRRALDESRSEDDVHLVNWFPSLKEDKGQKKLREIADPSMTIEMEQWDSVQMVAELAVHCTTRDPKQRPQMSNAVAVLTPLVQEWKPTDPLEDGAGGIDVSIGLNEALEQWKMMGEGDELPGGYVPEATTMAMQPLLAGLGKIDDASSSSFPTFTETHVSGR